jgi:hypothetical protein
MFGGGADDDDVGGAESREAGRTSFFQIFALTYRR